MKDHRPARLPAGHAPLRTSLLAVALCASGSAMAQIENFICTEEPVTTTAVNPAEISAGSSADSLLDVFDEFGHSVTSVGDLDGDGLAEIAVGSSQDDDGDFPGVEIVDTGAVYIFFLDQFANVRNIQKISETSGDLTGAGNPGGLLDPCDRFGSAVHGIGDLDLDGVPDLAVGANRDDDGGLDYGAVYILFMNPDGTVKARQKISTLEGGFTEAGGALVERDLLGGSIANMGDLDGDGVQDIFVGAHRSDIVEQLGAGFNKGRVFQFYMNRDGTVKAMKKISDNEGGFCAEGAGCLESGDRLGRSLTALGDVDGDGVRDIAIGTHRDDDGALNAGAMYIVFLNADGTVKGRQKISNFEGNLSGFGNPGGTLDEEDRFGRGVTRLGDLNNDGFPDIAVGAPRDDDGQAEGLPGDKGAVYVLFLRFDGKVIGRQKISDTRGGLSGPGNPGGFLQPGDSMGRSVATWDDADNNGVRELIVGVVRDDSVAFDAGAFAVLYLNERGQVIRAKQIPSPRN